MGMCVVCSHNGGALVFPETQRSVMDDAACSRKPQHATISAVADASNESRRDATLVDTYSDCEDRSIVIDSLIDCSSPFPLMFPLRFLSDEDAANLLQGRSLSIFSINNFITVKLRPATSKWASENAFDATKSRVCIAFMNFAEHGKTST